MTEEKSQPDLEQIISTPDAIFARTRDEAFGYLVNELREQYSAAFDGQKLEIVQQLIVMSRVSHPIFDVLKSKADDLSPRGSKSPYDPRIARDIREKAGLNRRRLAKELGFTELKENHYVANLIYMYETLTRRPMYPQGRVAPKYFQWLKEKGYNPFNKIQSPLNLGGVKII